MRKILNYVIALTAVVSFQHAANAQKESRKTIEGSGKIVTREVSIQSFDQLQASGVFNLHLAQGDKEQVKIEADDNFQDLFTVKNEGSKLIIDMKDDVNIKQQKNSMKIYVTFKKLKSMDLSMVGGTSSDEKLSFDELKLKNQSVGSVSLDLNAQSLHMDNSSVGTVRLKGSADNAVIKTNSVGSLQAGEFIVQKMDIDNSGVGSAEVNATKELKVSDSFLGKVKNRGAAQVKRPRVI